MRLWKLKIWKVLGKFNLFMNESYIDGISYYEEIKKKMFSDEKEISIDLKGSGNNSNASLDKNGIQFLYKSNFDLVN